MILSRFEITFGSSAYAHLFVTNAMRDHLVQEWGLMFVLMPVMLTYN